MEKNSLNNENKIEKAKSICIIVLSVILVVNLIIGMISITNGGKFGFYTLRFFIMSSDSGENNTGDLIVANKTKASRLNEDDSIIYKSNNSNVINKIAKVEKNNKDVNIYVIKAETNAGTNTEANSENNTETSIEANTKTNTEANTCEKIENKDIMGKVLFKVRGIGNMAVFMKSPLGMLNFLLIILCIFIIVKKISERREETDENPINKETESNKDENQTR